MSLPVRIASPAQMLEQCLRHKPDQRSLHWSSQCSRAGHCERLPGLDPSARSPHPAAACAQVLEVVVDASNVPGEYALTILSECAAFPRRLVFFLKGQLEVSLPEPC